MIERERGSALVDFLLVSVLVSVLVLGVVQLALTLHVRTVLVDAAAEGARFAALHEGSLAAGQERTAALIDMTLPQAYAQQVSADTGTAAGVEVVEVHVRAPIPVLGLLGPSGVITVTGRAVAE
ncbi:pilus assembly protein [Ruania suaedae]|uniref:TadE/TadG family type IV pilus assembly protein n=1 Tax=Ruania suaedae TaxID=2897774 RepID=UPI001E341276|nr:TadE/TadG family type IV pilus assembly protein [Ruania suaedae]UFU03992.1 pilus assembly protein [Ruania suaedae]